MEKDHFTLLRRRRTVRNDVLFKCTGSLPPHTSHHNRGVQCRRHLHDHQQRPSPNFAYPTPSPHIIYIKMKLFLSLFALVASANAFAPATTGVISRSVALNVVTGAGGSPAASKEEDLELTTQIILDYVNTQNDEAGIDDSDDE